MNSISYWKWFILETLHGYVFKTVRLHGFYKSDNIETIIHPLNTNIYIYIYFNVMILCYLNKSYPLTKL